MKFNFFMTVLGLDGHFYTEVPHVDNPIEADSFVDALTEMRADVSAFSEIEVKSIRIERVE